MAEGMMSGLMVIGMSQFRDTLKSTKSWLAQSSVRQRKGETYEIFRKDLQRWQVLAG